MMTERERQRLLRLETGVDQLISLFESHLFAHGDRQKRAIAIVRKVREETFPAEDGDNDE